MKNQAGLRRICVICLLAMIVMFIVHVQVLVMFNQREMTVQGNDSGSSARMEIDVRGSSTSSWLKRDFTLTDERKADLTGQTIDGTLYNNSGDAIREWTLRINITTSAGTGKDTRTGWWERRSPWKRASWRWRTCTTRWSASAFTRNP